MASKIKLKCIKIILFTFIVATFYVFSINNIDYLKSIISYKAKVENSSIVLLTVKNEKMSRFDKLIKEQCPTQNLNISYKCLEKLNEFKVEAKDYSIEDKVFLFHTFWKVNESLPHHKRVLVLQILSFLATQDLRQSTLIIWLQDPFSDNVNKTLTKKFTNYLKNGIIVVRLLNFKELCSNGLFKQRYEACISSNNKNSVAFSDFIRFLVLYKYGGIYTDGDVIYLRSMRPLLNKNFVYRWSAGHSYNTAVMGVKFNRGKAVDAIYDKILDINNNYIVELTSSFHPRNIKAIVWCLNKMDIYNYEDFEVYSSILFDPAWLCNDLALPRYNNKSVCIFAEFYETVITSFEIEKFYMGR
jgi:hypothetical protein